MVAPASYVNPMGGPLVQPPPGYQYADTTAYSKVQQPVNTGGPTARTTTVTPSTTTTTPSYGSLFSGILDAGLSAYGANQAANASQAAGAQAAQMAQFRPVGVTTRFGRSGFNYGPNGELIGAGYQAAPDVAAMREGLLGLSGGALAQAQMAQQQQKAITGAAEGLFGLGQGYVAKTPEEAAAAYMQQQQALLAPQREQQLAQLRNRLQQTGRSGLSIGATSAGNLAATNPEMAAYYNALAQQDAQLAAAANDAAMRQVQFGQGLMSGAINLQNQGFGTQQQALAPFQTAFNTAANIEQQAQNALSTGAGLGSSAAQAGAQAAAAQRPYQQSSLGFDNARNQAAINALRDPVRDLISRLLPGG